MRKIILYIASSLDGYIADKDNSIDWLTSYMGDYGYDAFLQTVDTVFMGRKTYDAVVSMGVPDPHPQQTSYVFTRSAEQYHSTHNIIFTSRNPVECAQELKLQQGKNIFLVGGSELISSLLNMNQIDEVILFIVPVILGGGIPLFNGSNARIVFDTVLVKKYNDGMVELHLTKRTTT